MYRHWAKKMEELGQMLPKADALNLKTPVTYLTDDDVPDLAHGHKAPGGPKEFLLA